MAQQSDSLGWFPAPTWQLKIICNSSCRVIQSPLLTSRALHPYSALTYMQAKYSTGTKKIKLAKLKLNTDPTAV